MHRTAFSLLLGTALVTGCTAPSTADEDGRDDTFTADGKLDGVSASPAEAAAILSVVNTLPAARLVTEVELSANAADAIVAVRIGDDGAAGTADDVAFATLAQLDAVPYVGPIAFAQLLAYVHAADLVGDVPVREWHTSTVANGWFSDVTVSPGGQPVVTHRSDETYYILLPDGSTATLPELRYTRIPQVAVDGAGTPHVIYGIGDPLVEYGHMTYRDGTWTQHATLPPGQYDLDQGANGAMFALRMIPHEGPSPLSLVTLRDAVAIEEPLWAAGPFVHLNVDPDGSPALAWEDQTVRVGRRTAAGWQTRASTVDAAYSGIATTGGPTPMVALLRYAAIRLLRTQGAVLSEVPQLIEPSFVGDIDATVDAQGTAHFCHTHLGTLVHTAIDATGEVMRTPLGAGERCWIGLDRSGTLHIMSVYGRVINHARFE